MTSPNKPTSKSSRVAKMSVKPIWRKKPNLCNTSNVLNATSPMPKPLTPHHEPTQENNHPNQAYNILTSRTLPITTVGDGRIDGQGGPVGGQGSEVNDGVNEVPGFSTIIAQQLQNLLPTIVAQVGDQGRGQGNGRNQNGDAVNDNIHADDMSGCRDSQKVKYTAGLLVGKALTWEEFCPSNEMQKLETELWNHAIIRAGHATYTDRFHKLARLVPHLVTPEGKRIERYAHGLAPQIRGMVAATELKTIQKAVQIAGTLTDEALRNGSIKKIPKKRGNKGEPSKDRNGREDNKRTGTGNAFATTTNPVRRENTGAVPKCTTCNTHHPPEAPCRACFNCNHPGHFSKDCRVVGGWCGWGRWGVRRVWGGGEGGEEGVVGGGVGGGWVGVGGGVVTGWGRVGGEGGDGEVSVMEIEIASGTTNRIDRRETKNRNKKMAESNEMLSANEKKLAGIVVVRDFPSGIHGSDEPKHEMHLVLVLELLKKEKLYAKFSKCEFWLREVQFLGHVINVDGIHVDPSKIEAVKNWKAPRTPSEVARADNVLGSSAPRLYVDEMIKDLLVFMTRLESDRQFSEDVSALTASSTASTTRLCYTGLECMDCYTGGTVYRKRWSTYPAGAGIDVSWIRRIGLCIFRGVYVTSCRHGYAVFP
ncbi:putative reverse transcriptase domain-containing protein [Tanacetum coccineum]